MRRLCTLALVIAVATPLMASDLTERIKGIAQRYTESTAATDDAVTYTIFAATPVRGYHNLISLREYDDGRKQIYVKIYERRRNGQQQLVALVDDDADGTLDYTYTTVGATIDEAYAKMQANEVVAQRATKQDIATYEQLRTLLLRNGR